MSVALIVVGVILVLAGILTITKKWMWIQQGVVKRPVHVEKYMRYMGGVDIIFGLLGMALGILGYGDNIRISALLVYFPIKIWGEIKYRKKEMY